MPFARHDSIALRHAYPGYQGQHPSQARFIFLGLDPNYPPGIGEDLPLELQRYFANGAGWWHDNWGAEPPNQRHHPLCRGIPYHKQFRALVRATGLGAALAPHVCFLELVGFPTVGSATEDLRAFVLYDQFLASLENRNHLRQVNNWLFGDRKVKDTRVFISEEVYKRIWEVHLWTHLFPRLDEIPPGEKFVPPDEGRPLRVLYQARGVSVHGVYHFSYRCLNAAHLARIQPLLQL